MRTPRARLALVAGALLGAAGSLACPPVHAPADAAGDATAPDAAPGDRALPPGCRFEGLGTQAQGQPCGCVEDCQPGLDRCARNALVEPTASPYCSTGCDDDGDCAPGHGCFAGLPLLGQEPFCQRCLSSAPGIAAVGERCVCHSDCQRALGDGPPRATACIRGACAISPCDDDGPDRCPRGQTCERGDDGTTACVPCLNRVPAEQGAACQCARDCAQDLRCVAGVCRRPCVDDTGCGAGQECREQALGGGLCADLSAQCGGAGDHLVGERCACNADCVAEAPTCLTLELGPLPLAMCTQRPCDVFVAGDCPEGADGPARCCWIPTVLPATCLPPNLANLIGGYALCGP